MAGFIGMEQTRKAITFLDILDKHADVLAEYVDFNDVDLEETLHRAGIKECD